MSTKKDFSKMKSCVLKVNIHCDGCKHKVKKHLEKVDGVQSINISLEQGKVTVMGNVNPILLIRKLKKSGKHAELWGSQRFSSQPMNNQFKDVKIDRFRGGNDNWSQKGGQGKQLHPQFQKEKGWYNHFKIPQYRKPVEFSFSDCDDGFDVHDQYKLFEDDQGFDDCSSEGHHHQKPIKVARIMGDSHGPSGANGRMNGQFKNYDGGHGKKGSDSFDLSIDVKGMSRKSDCKNEKELNLNQGREGDSNRWVNVKGVNHGSFEFHGGKQGETIKNDHFQDMNINHHGPIGRKMDVNSMSQMRNNQLEQEQINGGGYCQQEMKQANPYNIQQYMAQMIVNQQRTSGDVMFHPMVYGRQHPAVVYGQPVVAPPQIAHDFTTLFNDENTNSCAIL